MKKKKKFIKCPVCGVSLKIDNLVEHLRSAHVKTIDGRVDRERAKANQQKVDTGNGCTVTITAFDAALEKGVRLIASRKFKRAIKVLKTIPEEYTNIDNVYMLIGITYIQLNRPEDALIYFEKAVKSDPNDPMHWYNVGFAYFFNSSFAKSRECLNNI